MKEQEDKEFNYKEAAYKLWELLDSIDTLSDICKPTVQDPKAAMAYYNNSQRYAAERFKILKSDGYKLFTPKEYDFIEKPRKQFPDSEKLLTLE